MVWKFCDIFVFEAVMVWKVRIKRLICLRDHERRVLVE